MSNSTYFAALVMAAHLRVEHGWTWKRLKEFFSGRSKEFWEEVRWTVDDMQGGV